MLDLINNSLEGLFSIELESECAILTWRQYVTSEEFIEISEKFLEFIQKHQVRKIINDARLASHITDEADQQWLIENYIPRLMAYGLKASAIVLPTNRLIKLQVEDVVDEVGPVNIPTQYFSNVDDAKKWIECF
jgi:hypothetical protein